MTWAAFWGLLLLFTLVLYAIMAVYVTIGGFVDIRRMFQKLGNRPDENDDSSR